MVRSCGSSRGKGRKAQCDEGREGKLHDESNNNDDALKRGIYGFHFVQIEKGWIYKAEECQTQVETTDCVLVERACCAYDGFDLKERERAQMRSTRSRKRRTEREGKKEKEKEKEKRRKK